MGTINSLDLDEKMSCFGLTTTKYQFVGILSIVYHIPLTICHLTSSYFIFRHRNDEQISNFFKKRHKKLFLFWYFVNTYWICCHMYIVSFTRIYFYPPSDVTLSLSWLVGYSTFILSFALVCVRVWLLYFNYNYQIVQVRKLWKQHLYSNKESYNSWFLNNKQFSNVNFLLKITFTFVFLSSIFMFFGAFFYNLLFHMFGLTVFVSIAIFFIFLVYKLNQESSVDNFWIRKEINFITIVTNVVLFSFLIPYFMIRINIIRMYLIGCGISFGMTVISLGLFYGVWKLKQQQQGNRDDDPNYKHVNYKINIYQVLENKHGLNLFADFLVREFCCENLLFVIAIIQYKQQIFCKIGEVTDVTEVTGVTKTSSVQLQRQTSDHKNTVSLPTVAASIQSLGINIASTSASANASDDETVDNNSISNRNKAMNTGINININTSLNVNARKAQSRLENLSIPNDIPLSYIISENSENTGKQAMAIVEKYIGLSSDLMVNVSSDVRSGLLSFVEQIKMMKYDELNEYYNVFDDALLEIFRLLQSVFIRFRTRKEGIALAKYFVTSQNGVGNKVRRLSLSLSQKKRQNVANV